MPSPNSSWLWFDLGIKCDEADLADNDVVKSGTLCPVNGTIREVWVGTQTLPTTGTLAVAKGTTNVLSAATVNLASDIVAGVGESVTLANAAACKVTAGNMLLATWTLSDITVTDDAVFSCLVGVEPDYS